MLYETVDAFCENAFKIALAWTSASVSCHHAGHGGVGTEEGAEFRGCFKLRGEHGLEHGEEEMLLPTLVLVAIESEHDGLEQRVDFRQADKSAEVGDMAWFRLEEEKKIRVLL